MCENNVTQTPERINVFNYASDLVVINLLQKQSLKCPYLPYNLSMEPYGKFYQRHEMNYIQQSFCTSVFVFIILDYTLQHQASRLI